MTHMMRERSEHGSVTSPGESDYAIRYNGLRLLGDVCTYLCMTLVACIVVCSRWCSIAADAFHSREMSYVQRRT